MAADRRPPMCSCIRSARRRVERLGFAPDAVLARNPRIVYAALTGYGTGGPYAGQPAYDDVIQGQSGIASLMSQLAGEPRYAPMIMGDKTCGLVASQAITAALFARERTGRGQYVEVPMLETMAAFVLAEHLFGHTFDPPKGGIGYNRVLAPWRRPTRRATAISPCWSTPTRSGAGSGRSSAARTLAAIPRFADHGRPCRQHRRGLSHRRRVHARPHDRGIGSPCSRRTRSPPPTCARSRTGRPTSIWPRSAFSSAARTPTEGDIVMPRPARALRRYAGRHRPPAAPAGRAHPPRSSPRPA